MFDRNYLSFASLLKLTSTVFKTHLNYKKVGNLGTVLHETSRLLADQFDVEPSAVIAVSLQFNFSFFDLSAKCIEDKLSVPKIIDSMGFICRILVR